MELDYDNEMNILADLHDVDSNECLILSDDEGTKHYWNTAKIIDEILSENCFLKWKDNTSSHSPPDFINTDDKLILEVMRFDEDSADGKKNPVLARERTIANEIKSSLNFPQQTRVMINANTSLPTDEDHNYRFLYTSFQRTVRKHLTKLKAYRNYYPKTKSIFLVLNETSGNYFEVNDDGLCRPHIIFYDNRFLETFIDSDLDYLILFNPYNHVDASYVDLELPKVIIFDISRLRNCKIMKFFNYDESRMKSSEI